MHVMGWKAMAAKSNRKYQHSEYEDVQIDGLMRYFRLQDYGELKWLLRGMKKGQ